MTGAAGLVMMGLSSRAGRWAWLAAAIILSELVFLYRVDILNSPIVQSSFGTLKGLSLPDTRNHSLAESGLGGSDIIVTGSTEQAAEVVEVEIAGEGGGGEGEGWTSRERCEEWLEKADRLEYARNFFTHPVLVESGESQDWPSCAVPCVFKGSFHEWEKPDAAFGWRVTAATHVLRSMESPSYYPENDVDVAHRRGFDVVMTTSLASDVPVGYFSWAEYDLMAPVGEKMEEPIAAAFISNCGAHNSRLAVMEKLIEGGVSVGSYGACFHNRGDRGVNKLETLMRYKFSLAFENSNVDDYVTEKFWQSLVAGAIPVVVGAPNIEDFEPAPNSLIHIRDEEDVAAAVAQMKYLAGNASAFNESLRWKVDGPTDKFKALVDMATVHSSCRLCIHLATKIRANEESNVAAWARRPCRCKVKDEVVHHVFVRERGRFELESVFLSSGNMSVEALEEAVLDKFQSIQHVPVWKGGRPKEISGGEKKLRIYKMYPVGLTQREALYSWDIRRSIRVKEYLEARRCAKFEVIFV